MEKLLTAIFLLSLVNVAFAQKTNEVKWMVGDWKIETPQGNIVESWKIKNDSTLSGQSYFIAGKDTMPQEKIEMKFRKGNWYYHPILNGQNETNSTSFKVIYCKKEEFISENPGHDFPQRISYRKIGKGLFANIEGLNKGKYVKENFDFTSEN